MEPNIFRANSRLITATAYSPVTGAVREPVRVWLPGAIYCWLAGHPGMAIFLVTDAILNTLGATA